MSEQFNLVGIKVASKISSQEGAILDRSKERDDCVLVKWNIGIENTEWMRLRELTPKSPPFGCEFSVGDKVSFVNDYGVRFDNRTVVGFDLEPLCGRYIYIDSDSPWMPVRPSHLRKAKA